MTNSFSAELPQDPQYYEYGIELGLTPLSSEEYKRPVLIGSRNEELLHLKGCHVKLDDERTLTASSLVTNSLTIGDTIIKGVSTLVNDKQDPDYLMTLGRITQYVKDEIKSIKPVSPWEFIDSNIYYHQGWVGVGSINSTMMRLSCTEDGGSILVDNSGIKLDSKAIIITSPALEFRSNNNVRLKAEEIVSFEANTTEIKSTKFILEGDFYLGTSVAVNKISSDLSSADLDFVCTLPTAQAVTDFVHKYVEENRPTNVESIWDMDSKSKSIFYTAGNVGIGTNVPVAALHIAQGAIMPSIGDKDNGIVFPNDPASGSGDRAWIKYFPFKDEDCVLEIGTSNDFGDHIAICPSGLLGIGTKEPSLAMVHIAESWERKIGNAYAYLGPNIPSTGRCGPYEDNANYSLYAVGRIAGEEFNALSDVRIKEVHGQSDCTADLTTLLSIQITDYSFKDKIQRGHGHHKKVIGQHLASIFPQAVKTHSDVIPDIYCEATIGGGWVQLPNHGLSVGERVRLLWKDSEPVIYKIEEAIKDSFRVPLQYEGEIFVYGREVDDFHVVDYEAISMLHVSATQALYKIIQGLKQDVEDLKTQLATMNGTGLSPTAHA